MDDLKIKLEELTRNPCPRVPVCLCLDVSGSMEGEPMRELNRALAKFFDEVMANKMARYSADISVVTFGSSAHKIVDFRSVESQRAPVLRAEGMTAMGHGVELSLDALELRKLEYQRVGNDYYQPWLVLMTDGQPTDDIASAVQRAQQLVQTRKLTVFSIAIGPHADLATLARFSPGRAPFRLRGLAFAELFTWLSQSVVRVSSTSVGDDFVMPDPKSWNDPY